MSEIPHRSLRQHDEKLRLFGLIGYPLSHSFSKKFFTEKFQSEGILNCRYELFSIPQLDQLPELLKANADLEGLNVTIPYKRQVLSFLNSKDGIPEGLDACNCIRIRNGKLEGFNTDVFGFEESLRPLISANHDKALVLGNGGATAAVVHVLKKLGITYEIVSRQLHEGSTLTYKQVNDELVGTSKLIINTTPLGMYPNTDECPPIPYSAIGKQHLLYDLHYNPPETLFLKKGRETGARIKNGEEMLILQAEESWRIWNQ